ncbi:hypothetical protein [Mycobacterium sp.]|uniref:hypothetical protein n=1 Tax=Mycobacterium sp. TaxID=1785 RepID=UPI002D711A50|nr:hypothetical protein [Mycobacterium sp.]HZA08921.1 hypothetical protein [Mycobacterium sp.]
MTAPDTELGRHGQTLPIAVERDARVPRIPVRDGAIGEFTPGVAYQADRKPFPFLQWNLAFQLLRNHCLIMTISLMGFVPGKAASQLVER